MGDRKILLEIRWFSMGDKKILLEIRWLSMGDRKYTLRDSVALDG